MHLLGWLLLGLVSFLQQPGQVAADTKHDLTADLGFYAGDARLDGTFTLGQLQIRPTGIFFRTARSSCSRTRCRTGGAAPGGGWSWAWVIQGSCCSYAAAARALPFQVLAAFLFASH